MRSREKRSLVGKPGAEFERLPAGGLAGHTRALLKSRTACDSFCATVSFLTRAAGCAPCTASRLKRRRKRWRRPATGRLCFRHRDILLWEGSPGRDRVVDAAEARVRFPRPARASVWGPI